VTEESLTFVPWMRRRADVEQVETGRAVQRLDVRIEDGVDAATARLRFALPGPQDVVGLRPGAVRLRYPAAGDRRMDEEHLPFVEFAAEDLPWRCSAAFVGDAPVPWCVLVVARPDDLTFADDSVTLGPTARAHHPLSEAAAWAHVQRATDEPGRPGVARLVSPAGMMPDTDYVSVLVVPWGPGGTGLWTAARQEQAARVLATWRFRTGAAGTFEELARELHPADGERVGAVTVRVPGGGQVDVPGALTGLNFQWNPLPEGDPGLVHDLLRPRTQGGREVVGPPVYGDAWGVHDEIRDAVLEATDADQATWGWQVQVNTDLRARIAAGVGLEAGIDLQEEIVEAADRQWGAAREAAALLNGLALGGRAAEALWSTRLPTDVGGRLAVLGAAADRIPLADDDGRTLLDALTQPSPAPAAEAPGAPVRDPFPAGLLGPRLAHTVGRERLRSTGGHSALLDALTQPSPAAAAEAPDAPVRNPFPAGLLGPRLARTVGRESRRRTGGHPALLDVVVRKQRPAGRPAEEGGSDYGHLDTLMRAAGQQVPNADVDGWLVGQGLAAPKPLPHEVVDAGRLDETLVGMLDPRAGAARRRVQDRLTGVDDLDAPLEDCPNLDLPAWRYLRDRAPHWLLPGIETLQPGEVVALRTCREFIESFLIGLNHRALGELRWRQHAVRRGCTPLRRFWDLARPPGDPDRDDIVPVSEWATDSRLGAHASPQVAGEHLALVVRSELFSRYPSTVLYLAPLCTDLGLPEYPDPPWTRGSEDLSRPVPPITVAPITSDLTLFLFALDPPQIRRHWVVVEQIPEGMRFERKTNPGPDGLPAPAGTHGMDGASFAAAHVYAPIRVLLEGPDTVGVSKE
jgi:hypothetical protein